jgi:uncharacterized protein YbaP (TraB family)
MGLLSILATCLALAQAAAAGPAAPSRPFLWTVRSPTATVHLLGSIHLATPDIYPLDPRIEAAFQAAGTLVLELPLDPATQVQAAARLAEAGTYPPGDTIDLHLDRALLEALQQRLRQSGVAFSTVRSQRPWFVALMLSLGEMQRLGFRPELGVDLHLAARAQGQKRIRGLETVDEQVAIFAGMSDALQAQMLRDSLERLDEIGELLQRARALWRAGDAEGMYEVLMAPMRGEFPGIYQRLVTARNRRMAAAIEGYLRGDGVTFVVVGSGHLGGPEGILPLLRAKGYRPTQP